MELLLQVGVVRRSVSNADRIGDRGDQNGQHADRQYPCGARRRVGPPVRFLRSGDVADDEAGKHEKHRHGLASPWRNIDALEQEAVGVGGKDRQRRGQANKIQIGGEISVERRAGTGHGMINRVRCSSPAMRDARAASVFDVLSLRRNFRRAVLASSGRIGARLLSTKTPPACAQEPPRNAPGVRQRHRPGCAGGTPR